MDSHRVSQLSLKSGKTKRKLKPLAGVQSQIALTCCSASGSVMAGLTCQGDLFLWHQDSQVLETYISPLSKMTKEKGKADLNHFQGTFSRRDTFMNADCGHFGSYAILQATSCLYRTVENRHCCCPVLQTCIYGSWMTVITRCGGSSSLQKESL